MANMQKEDKKQIRKYIKLGIGAAVVILLAVMPMLAEARDAREADQASILSASAEYMAISTNLIGGGQLASEASIEVEIPENVKLTELLAGNGDVVSKGDAIARVDRVSVMSAIMEVQDTLDYLAEEISASVSDTEAESVRAQAGGIVKIINGQKGESAQEVMLRDGCLAVLSLDGLMAVKIQRYTDLKVGQKVAVYLADEREAEGRVAGNQDGTLVVTVEDDGYQVGTKVMVKTLDDDRIGSGELYIYSQWNATGYSGRIYDIQVRENEKVAAGRVLFLLKDSGNTAQFQRLVDQRQEYEELMQELFVMYQTQSLTSPCDGIVTGLDEDAAYLLSQEGSDWMAQLLSFFNRQDNTAFRAFPVEVTAVQDDGMTLKIDPAAFRVTDLEKLSQLQVNLNTMTESWNYKGDSTVYRQAENGILSRNGKAQTGDILLMVGDEENICWFVELDGTNVIAETADINGSDIYTEYDSDSGKIMLMSHGDQQEEAGEQFPTAENPVPDVPSQETENSPDMPGESEDSSDDVNDDAPAEEENPDVNDQEPEQTEPIVSYRGYIAKVMEITAGSMKVMREKYNTYNIVNLDSIPGFTPNDSNLTEEEIFFAEFITENTAKVGDYVLLILDADGALIRIAVQTAVPGGNGGGMPGAGGAAMPNGGGAPGGTGGMMTPEPAFQPYSLEKLTVASVTSQEHMTVSVTVDELEISGIYIGQAAVVSVDALGGEQFDAAVTKISNSGTNEGGNSKFTVELTLARSGDMLPGMYASAVITLQEHDCVLSIPVAALNKDGRNVIVYTGYNEEDRTLENPVVVTTGVADGENVQILTGLSEGQTVYYSYYDTYAGSEESESAGFSMGMMGRRR